MSARLRALAPAWVTGAITVLLGMSLVNAGNYAVNIVFGRYLGPAEFGDVVFTTTGLLVLSAGAVALQSAVARATASRTRALPSTGIKDLGASNFPADIVHTARQLSLVAGAIVCVLLVLGARPLAAAFRVESVTPFWWLGALAPLHFMQGAQRGVLQGEERMTRFTATFQAEMVVRLFGSWLALTLGYGLDGVCAALALSIVASLVAGDVRSMTVKHAAETRAETHELTRMLAPALITQFSVVAFTQTDILVVKSFAAPELAGAFAVVVLLSRIVTFATQAVNTPLLPAIVARVRNGQSGRRLLLGGLVAVSVVSLPLLLIAFWVPSQVVTVLFGAQHHSAAPFLGPYLVAILIHAWACVMIDYAFCHGIRFVSYLAAGVGLAKIVVTTQWASSIAQAVWLSVGFSLGLLLLAGGAALSSTEARQRYRAASGGAAGRPSDPSPSRAT